MPPEPAATGSPPWILIPLFNEARSIGPLLHDIIQQSYPVLVVDDGSQDEGPQIARTKGCIVLSLGKNCGKGSALRRGFEYLLLQPSWDIVVLMDSDGQHEASEIPRFVKTHRDLGIDVVVGNRMETRQKNMPWVRWVTNRFTSYCVSKLAGQRINDSQCGFRSMRRAVLANLSLTCERFDLESEMLIQAGRKGFKIISIPIRTIYYEHRSRIRPLADTVRFFRLLLKYSITRGVAQLG